MLTCCGQISGGGDVFLGNGELCGRGCPHPAGRGGAEQAARTDRRYLTLAAFPALFGVQQVFEGLLWRSLGDATPGFSRGAAMAFLLFAYLLWLVLTPLAAFLVEDRAGRRRAFLAATIFGAVYGLSLYLPLVVRPDWLAIELARGSILYDTRLIYNGIVPTPLLRMVYAAVICLPLLASTARGVRVFGVLVTLSVAAAFLFATYAFSSIWCFLAAMVSAYVVFLTYSLPAARRVQGAIAGGFRR